LELYSQREEPDGNIYVARRATPDSKWSQPVKLGPAINTSDYEGGACISADGLSFYFSRASGGIFVTRRATTKDDWGPPVNLGPVVNPGLSFAPSITADELDLYFYSDRPGSFGDLDIWATSRPSANDAWGTPVNLGPTVNSAYREHFPSISADGLALFFDSTRPGGEGGFDLYMSRRATRQDPWGAPVNLGPVISAGTAITPHISRDGSILYFSRYGQGLGLWQVPVIPLVDFNGDGKVDAKDLGLLADNWGKNTSLCDIRPFAWGDGVVDEKDLGVLMESLVAPQPKASDVPCDVTLNWISPSFANACDVYLGTSQEAVQTASRTNPQGVLVGKAEVGTTYDPADPLKYSQTYYWRVDFVIAGPTPTIITGPVLSFTTAAFAYPIKNITATASLSQVNMGPEKTVNGSGLDKSDGHSTSGTDMWLSTTGPHWIQYQFDKVYTLHELWVWNSNQPIESFIGFGAKTVKIEYSTDGTTWTALANVPEFAKATGKPGYTANTIVSLGGVSAKYVRLTIEKGWGSTPSAGLSEVRFFAIQSATVKP
jgi:hypothetical protein